DSAGRAANPLLAIRGAGSALGLRQVGNATQNSRPPTGGVLVQGRADRFSAVVDRRYYTGTIRRSSACERVAPGREALARIRVGECVRNDKKTAAALATRRSVAPALLLSNRGGRDDHLHPRDSGR